MTEEKYVACPYCNGDILVVPYGEDRVRQHTLNCEVRLITGEPVVGLEEVLIETN